MSNFKNFIVNFEEPTGNFLSNPVVDFITQPSSMGPFPDAEAMSAFTPSACDFQYISTDGGCGIAGYITSGDFYTWTWPSNIPENFANYQNTASQKYVEAFIAACQSTTPNPDTCGPSFEPSPCEASSASYAYRIVSYSVEIYNPATDTFSSIGGANWNYYNSGSPESSYSVPKDVIYPYEEYSASYVGSCELDENGQRIVAETKESVPATLTYKLKTVAADVNVSQKLTAGVGVYRAIKKFYEEWAQVPGLPAGNLASINQQITLANKIITIFETGVLPEDPQSQEYVKFMAYMCEQCATDPVVAYSPKRPEIILKVVRTIPTEPVTSDIYYAKIGIKLAGRVVPLFPVGANINDSIGNYSVPVEESIYTDSNFPIAVRILARDASGL